MLDLLTGFVGELRAAGVPVSTVEAIDAATALSLTPTWATGRRSGPLSPPPW